MQVYMAITALWKAGLSHDSQRREYSAQNYTVSGSVHKCDMSHTTRQLEFARKQHLALALNTSVNVL
jgi:hypothetical protein